MTRTIRSLAAFAASIALLLAAPGFVGIAAAHDNGSGQSALAPELYSAVKTARFVYASDIRTARDAYRSSLVKIRTSIQTETAQQLKAVQDAKKAFDDAVATGKDQATVDALRDQLKTAIENYRKAIDDAKTAHQTDLANAQKVMVDAVTAAGSKYVKAVTDAFAKFAPGTTVTPGLLIPPGRVFQQGIGSLMGHSDQGLHLGATTRPTPTASSDGGSHHGDDD
jgi:hypothetical protein